MIVIAQLKSSKDKGKGRAPSNVIDGLEDDIVDPEASPGYDERLTPEGESDDDDSDFEGSEPDYEDEDDRDITFNVRKFPSRRTSRVDIKHLNDFDEVEKIMFAAATEASIRDVSGGASTSAGSSGCIVPWSPMVAATPEYDAGSEVVPDSEPEDELLMVTYPEDEPLVVQRGRISLGKSRGRNKGHGKTEFDADNIRHDAFSARREARKGSRLEKQEIRMLEYQLGRRLTYVGLASNLYALISPFRFLTWF